MSVGGYHCAEVDTSNTMEREERRYSTRFLGLQKGTIVTFSQAERGHREPLPAYLQQKSVQ